MRWHTTENWETWQKEVNCLNITEGYKGDCHNRIEGNSPSQDYSMMDSKNRKIKEYMNSGHTAKIIK